MTAVEFHAVVPSRAHHDPQWSTVLCTGTTLTQFQLDPASGHLQLALFVWPSSPGAHAGVAGRVGVIRWLTCWRVVWPSVMCSWIFSTGCLAVLWWRPPN